MKKILDKKIFCSKSPKTHFGLNIFEVWWTKNFGEENILGLNLYEAKSCVLSHFWIRGENIKVTQNGLNHILVLKFDDIFEIF